MKVLITETIPAVASGFLITVYNADTNSNNIQLSDIVSATGFPPNLVTVGTAFSPQQQGTGGNVDLFPIENSVLLSTTVRMPSWTQTYVIPGLELDSTGNEYEVITGPFWTPPGTYIVSVNLITVGGTEFLDVNFNQPISYLGFSVQGSRMKFNRPATLNVSSQIAVTNATEVSVIDPSQLWDNCPLPTIVPVVTLGSGLQATEVENLGLLTAVNGAGWDSTTLNFGNINSWKDINFEITSQFQNSIPDVEVNHFALDQTNQSYNEQRQATIPLLNTSYQDPTLTATAYTINYRVSDSDDFIDCSVIVNLGLQVLEEQEYTLTATPEACSGGGGSSGPVDSFVAKFVVIKTLGQPGFFSSGFNYYAYFTNSQGPGEFPSWNHLVGQAGSGNITIDNTDTGNDFQAACRNTGWLGPYNSLTTTYSGGIPFTLGLLQDIALRAVCVEDTCLVNADSLTGIFATLTGGFGTNRPLDPPVENFTWTLQNP